MASVVVVAQLDTAGSSHTGLQLFIFSFQAFYTPSLGVKLKELRIIGYVLVLNNNVFYC